MRLHGRAHRVGAVLRVDAHRKGAVRAVRPARQRGLQRHLERRRPTGRWHTEGDQHLAQWHRTPRNTATLTKIPQTNQIITEQPHTHSLGA